MAHERREAECLVLSFHAPSFKQQVTCLISHNSDQYSVFCFEQVLFVSVHGSCPSFGYSLFQLRSCWSSNTVVGTDLHLLAMAGPGCVGGGLPGPLPQPPILPGALRKSPPNQHTGDLAKSLRFCQDLGVQSPSHSIAPSN